MASRGPDGRFAPATPPAPAAADGLPLLIDLAIDPVVEPMAMPVPPLLSEDMPEPGTDAAGGGADDARLAAVLARAINEAVGVAFGASYKADDAQVAGVGEAAEPVMRRAFAFFHAAELADSAIPAPIRELAVLGLRAFDAWGDAAVLTAQRTWTDMRARGAREVDDGSPGGSADDGQRGIRSAGRANGPGDDGAAQVPAPARASEAVQAGSDPGSPDTFSRLSTVDTGARRRRPRAS